MRAPAPTPIVEELRGTFGASRARARAGGRAVLPFGIKEIDRHLPGGGLALGALHEVAGGGNGAIDGAAAALFAAVPAPVPSPEASTGYRALLSAWLESHVEAVIARANTSPPTRPGVGARQSATRSR